MTREQAIERAAKEVAGTKPIQIYDVKVCPVDVGQMDKLKQALAMPKDAEPVAYVCGIWDGQTIISPIDHARTLALGTILYTHPPKADPRRADRFVIPDSVVPSIIMIDGQEFVRGADGITFTRVLP